MPDTIKIGTVLIKEGTVLPKTLRVESEPCVPGWRLLKNRDEYGLDQSIRDAGWTLLHHAGEIKASAFGIDEQKTARKAVDLILGKPRSEEFNSLEIVGVDSVASKRFLGVTYMTVTAHSRHIQEKRD